MRDARFRPTAVGGEVTSVERAAWRKRAEFFLDAALLDEAEQKEAKLINVKWHRLATMDLVCGVEWQMVVTGIIDGWAYFSSLIFPLHPCIYLRPRATIVWDKGPDNLCATLYLLNKKRLRASFFFSPVHGLQRGMWGGCELAGKHAVLLVAVSVVNVERGPHHGEANWQQIKESTLEWKALAAHDRADPILKHLAPHIKRERMVQRGGDVDAAVNDDDLDEIVDTIDSCEFYRHKPTKTALTQWNTLNDNLENMFPEWSTKCIPLMHNAVHHGWTLADASKIMIQLRPADKDAVMESLATKE